MTNQPTKRDVIRKHVVWITATVQVMIGVTGIVMHYLQSRNGQPLDVVHALCFIGVALSGSNTLTTF